MPMLLREEKIDGNEKQAAGETRDIRDVKRRVGRSKG